MQYCLDIATKHKIGREKHETKLLTKIAYKGLLPDAIINKQKTGWTVPIGQWLKQGADSKLKKFYLDSMKEESIIHKVSLTQKANKAVVPGWVLKYWIKRYGMI
jgi:asparagine synthetase B (glutamine-hydrolysing)